MVEPTVAPARTLSDIEPQPAAPLVAVDRQPMAAPAAARPVGAGQSPRAAAAGPVAEALGFTMSDDITQLLTGLVAAQLVFDPVVRNRTARVQSKREGASSYTYNYAELAQLLNATRPALAGNGLALLQGAALRGSVLTISTRLAHISGQWIQNELSVALGNGVAGDPQAIGSAITYLRRYAAQPLLGVAPEDDDDGAAGSLRTGQPPVSMPQRETPVPTRSGAAVSPVPAPAAAGPVSEPLVHIVNVVARKTTKGTPFVDVTFSDGRRAAAFNSLVKAVEEAHAHGTRFSDVAIVTKNGFPYLEELTAAEGGQ